MHLVYPLPLTLTVCFCLSSVFKGSAVCVYSMADIRNVFNGPFAHKHGHNYQWTEYTGKIPYPRPGTVSFSPQVDALRWFPVSSVNRVSASSFSCPSVSRRNLHTWHLFLQELLRRSGELHQSPSAHVSPSLSHPPSPPGGQNRRGLQVHGAGGGPGGRCGRAIWGVVPGHRWGERCGGLWLWCLVWSRKIEKTFIFVWFSDRGTVQKVIVLPKDPTSMEELTLEEVEVFRVMSPDVPEYIWTQWSQQRNLNLVVLNLQSRASVKTMKISSKRVRFYPTGKFEHVCWTQPWADFVLLMLPQQQLYVSSEAGLTQVSLHRCGVYGRACSDCCLARDPYCAWDGESCSAFTPTTKRWGSASF